jgi:hypothetical protein
MKAGSNNRVVAVAVSGGRTRAAAERGGPHTECYCEGRRHLALFTCGVRQTFRGDRLPQLYCGDNLDPLRKLPEACVDFIYIDPPASALGAFMFNSNRNYEVP